MNTLRIMASMIASGFVRGGHYEAAEMANRSIELAEMIDVHFSEEEEQEGRANARAWEERRGEAGGAEVGSKVSEFRDKIMAAARAEILQEAHFIKIYPCGCKAGPGPLDMPDYCPDHGEFKGEAGGAATEAATAQDPTDNPPTPQTLPPAA